MPQCRQRFHWLGHPHGLAADAISAAAVLANQLPRVVNRAEALLPSTDTVSMPSRLRSATVTPAIRLPQASVGAHADQSFKAARVHHAPWRRGSDMAACGARAAAAQSVIGYSRAPNITTYSRGLCKWV
jgi:hypothetical protein